MNRFRGLVAVGVAALLGTAAPMQAQSVLGVDFTGPGQVFNCNSGCWTLGFQFDVTSPVTVTHLGYFDAGQDGLNRSHRVGLWDPFGSLIASTLVPQGTVGTLMGFFRMVLIAPVTLAAGTNYRVGGVSEGDPYAGSPSGFFTHPNIRFVEDRFAHGNTLSYPTQTNWPQPAWFGANFAVSTVPEPMSMTLLGTGLAGLGALRRRRRKTAE